MAMKPLLHVYNRPNNSDRDSTTEPQAKRQKVQVSIYLTKALGLITQNMMDLCLLAKIDLKTHQGIGLIPQPLMSLKTQMGIGHLRQDGGKGKDPKGKRYVGPALAGTVPPNRKSETYNYTYDDSDRVSIHAASNEESPPEQETDDMHSIIYKSSKISNAEQANDCQVPQLFTALAKETKKANTVHEKLATSLGKYGTDNNPTRKLIIF